MYSEDRTSITCAYCGNTFSYAQNEIYADGTVSCRGCGSMIQSKRPADPWSSESSATPTATPVPDKGTSVAWIWIIISVLIIVGLAVLVWKYMEHDKKHM